MLSVRLHDSWAGALHFSVLSGVTSIIRLFPIRGAVPSILVLTSWYVHTGVVVHFRSPGGSTLNPL